MTLKSTAYDDTGAIFFLFFIFILETFGFSRAVVRLIYSIWRCRFLGYDPSWYDKVQHDLRLTIDTL